METFPKFKRSKPDDDANLPPRVGYNDVTDGRPPSVDENTGYVTVCTEWYNEHADTKPKDFQFIDELLLQLQQRAAPTTLHIVAPAASGKPSQIENNSPSTLKTTALG